MDAGKSVRRGFRSTIVRAWTRKGGPQSSKKGDKGYTRRPKHKGKQES